MCRLKEPKLKEMFAEKFKERYYRNENWGSLKKKLSGVIREVCGYIKGKPRRVKTWWWDREVDVAVSRKRDLFIYLLFGKENY